MMFHVEQLESRLNGIVGMLRLLGLILVWVIAIIFLRKVRAWVSL